jgi:hypothetical protein
MEPEEEPNVAAVREVSELLVNLTCAFRVFIKQGAHGKSNLTSAQVAFKWFGLGLLI